MPQSGFRWVKSPDEIIKNLNKLPQKTRGLLGDTMNGVADMNQTRMKALAPWNNRTGHARASLRTFVTWENGNKRIVIYHVTGAWYGVRLETWFGGKYQIIMPTIYGSLKDVQEYLNGLWARAK